MTYSNEYLLSIVPNKIMQNGHVLMKKADGWHHHGVVQVPDGWAMVYSRALKTPPVTADGIMDGQIKDLIERAAAVVRARYKSNDWDDLKEAIGDLEDKLRFLGCPNLD